MLLIKQEGRWCIVAQAWDMEATLKSFRLNSLDCDTSKEMQEKRSSGRCKRRDGDQKITTGFCSFFGIEAG